MPLLSVTTSAVIEAHQRSDLLNKLSQLVAAELGKPERYVMVYYRHNPDMLFAGSDEPLAYLELKSIGLPADRTADISGILTAFTSEQLAIPGDRIYIEFTNAQRHMWGWNGGTF